MNAEPRVSPLPARAGAALALLLALPLALFLALAIAGCGGGSSPADGGDAAVLPDTVGLPDTPQPDAPRPDTPVPPDVPTGDDVPGTTDGPPGQDGATDAPPSDMTDDRGTVDVGPPPDGGPEEVEVPAGPFMMGCNAEVDTFCQEDELPYREVTLSAFFIDRTEVTQAAYQACVDAGACTVPSANYDPVGRASYPVVNVTWAQADTYCRWLGRRLPTEAEWEKAARGTDGRVWPWGNQLADCTLAPYSEPEFSCKTGVEPVGSHPSGASPYGALDMAGNVWEWTADYYDASYYASAPSTDPPGPATGTERAYRGGSHGNSRPNARASNRANTYSPDLGGSGLGFRCARSP